MQEVDAGPPESKIKDLPFELDAERSKIYLHKTANLSYEPYNSHEPNTNPNSALVVKCRVIEGHEVNSKISCGKRPGFH